MGVIAPDAMLGGAGGVGRDLVVSVRNTFLHCTDNDDAFGQPDLLRAKTLPSITPLREDDEDSDWHDGQDEKVEDKRPRAVTVHFDCKTAEVIGPCSEDVVSDSETDEELDTFPISRVITFDNFDAAISSEESEEDLDLNVQHIPQVAALENMDDLALDADGGCVGEEVSAADMNISNDTVQDTAPPCGFQGAPQPTGNVQMSVIMMPTVFSNAATVGPLMPNMAAATSIPLSGASTPPIQQTPTTMINVPQLVAVLSSGIPQSTMVSPMISASASPMPSATPTPQGSAPTSPRRSSLPSTTSSSTGCWSRTTTASLGSSVSLGGEELSLDVAVDPPLRRAARAGAKTQKATTPSMRTTVMLRNLPNNYSRTSLLELVDSLGFAGKYDFVYFPIDFRTHAALGYAFLNLVSPAEAERLRNRLDGFSDWAFPSCKVCNVGWSHPHQGLESHVERYRNSPLMHEDVPDEYRPILFSNGRRVPFPAPTKRIKPPRQGTQRMLV